MRLALPDPRWCASFFDGLRDKVIEDALSAARCDQIVRDLPAYLALESASSDAAPRLLALLVGVNVSPLVTVCASLAALAPALPVGEPRGQHVVPRPRRPALPPSWR